MENEKPSIFEEQLKKLPSSVVNFVSSANWNEDLESIGSMYNLTEEQLDSLRQETTLVLAGLVHPDEFSVTLGEETQLPASVLEAVVAGVEQKIFASVRGDLVGFFESEEEKENEQPQAAPIEKAPSQPSIAPENLPFAPEPEHLIPPIPPKPAPSQPAEPAPVAFVPKMPEVIMPQISTTVPVVAEHPFEAKMQQVFTAGQSSIGSVVLEPAPSVMPNTMEPGVPSPVAEVAPTPQVIQPTPSVPTEPVQTQAAFVPPAPPRKDPYREPVE